MLRANATQRNATQKKVNKLVRYNIRQAILLDIAMFFPSIFAFITSAVIGEDAVKLAPLAQAGSDVIFVTVALCVLYSVVSSAFGVLPDSLPLLSSMNREGARGPKDDGPSGGGDGGDKK